MKYLHAVFFIVFSVSFSLAAKDKITVVIDAGHGGSDPGHLSSFKDHLPEKEINLLIAKKFGTYIEQNLNNVSIIYTRTDDSYPTLTERVEKANSAKADYFISIHCNANHHKSVFGTESHVHTMDSKKSVGLAKEFENEFSLVAGRHSRGVKDSDDRAHSLQVLKCTNMASVLVECGFLTNEKEAEFLNSSNGQDIMASAIYRAFKNTISKDFPSISFLKVKQAEESASDSKKDTEKGSTAFTIQIMSSREPISTDKTEFKKVGLPVSRDEINTSSSYKYRYTIGNYTSQDIAKKDLEKIKQNGFKDAYIVRLE